MKLKEILRAIAGVFIILIVFTLLAWMWFRGDFPYGKICITLGALFILTALGINENY